ncbi:MAG: exosome complex exonuclease Rrp41 [Candidatus Aenigmatarchaeota archaeon]
MSKIGKPEKMIINGKRLDGRSLEEFRPITVEVGVLKRAEGSAVFKFGNTYALAAVYGPRTLHPKHMQNPQKAILRCRYSMAPFSTSERVRPGVNRRSVEISKVLNEALSNVIFFEDYPKTAIDVFVEILQADASTRCAGLNAASLALVEAGVPIKDLISSCSVGVVDGEIVLDIGGDEDQFGDVDMATATIGNEDKFVLLQMDGTVTKEQFFKMLELARKGCLEIYEKQKNALKERYKTGEINVEG